MSLQSVSSKEDDKMSDYCPHCHEALWYELGFDSEIDYEFQWWINYAYNFRVDVEIEEVEVID